MKLTRMIALATIVIVLGACGTTKIFTKTQLGGLLLGSADAPAGLQFITQGSGPQTLDQIAKDDAEKTKLTSYGFQSAYSSFFANTGAIAVLSQSTKNADPSSHVVAALGALFTNEDGATKALALEHASDVSTGTNITTVPVEKIGQETIAEAGTQENIPFPGFLIYWREGNAIFGVLVAGGPTAGVSLTEATGFARTMEARAERLSQ
jgi:hypothetical protein